MVRSVDAGTLLPVQVINWESYLFGVSVSICQLRIISRVVRVNIILN